MSVSYTHLAYSSPRWGEAMYVRYKEMPDDLDYVIVVGGHNDGFKLDSIGGIDAVSYTHLNAGMKSGRTAMQRVGTIVDSK